MTLSTSGCGTSVSISTSQGFVQVTPGAVDFGDVGIGQSAVSSIAITNPSPQSIVISQVNISGNAFSVAGPPQLPIQIPAGGTLALKIGFTPLSAASYSGSLTISSNSTTGGTAQVALTGTGTATASPQLAVSAASLSFGSQTVNTAKTQTLTLTSTGTSAVTMNSAAIAGAGFTLVGGTLPATLAPNQAVTLQVQFDPATAGAMTGSLTISSNSTTGGTATVALSGTGTAAAGPQTASNPQLAVSATSLSFGSVTVNTAKTQTLTLTSTGTSAVTVNS
ncbi:MAG TPA: choice-of-anchor D domain-containing protein, partial [Acidobacteriaceae bacterium]